MGAPQRIYWNLIVDGGFSAGQCELCRLTTGTTLLPIHARTTKVTDRVLIYFKRGVFYLL